MIRRFFSGLRSFLSQLPPETALLWVGGAVGLSLVFIVPPFEVPDEHRHFFRAYQISELTFLAQQGEDNTAWAVVPASVVDLAARQGRGDFVPGAPVPFGLSRAADYLSRPLQPDERDRGYLGSIGAYSPVGYIGEAAAISIGRLLGLPALALLYLARLANLIIWLALGYLAIKKAPHAKWPLLSLFLLPMAVFEAASAGVDGILIGAAFLFAVMVISGFTNRRRLTVGERVALLGVAAGLALIKPTYAILPTIALIIPKESFGGRRAKLKFGIILLAVSIIPVSLWQLTTKNIVNITFGLGIHPNVPQQLQHFVLHPLDFLQVLAASFLDSAGDGIAVSFAGSFGWLDFRLPMWAIILAFVVVYFALGRPGTKPLAVSADRRPVVLAILGATTFAICIVLYLTYNPVGASSLAGFQGRYLLPLLPFGFLLRRTEAPDTKRPLLSMSIILLLATLVCIYTFYY